MHFTTRTYWLLGQVTSAHLASIQITHTCYTQVRLNLRWKRVDTMWRVCNTWTTVHYNTSILRTLKWGCVWKVCNTRNSLLAGSLCVESTVIVYPTSHSCVTWQKMERSYTNTLRWMPAPPFIPYWHAYITLFLWTILFIPYIINIFKLHVEHCYYA